MTSQNAWPDNPPAPVRRDSIVVPLPIPHVKPSNPPTLLTLPDELRLLIYDHLLAHPEGIHLYFGGGGAHAPSSADNTAVLSALAAPAQTCRLLRAEFGPVVYRLPTLHLHVPMLRDPQRPRFGTPAAASPSSLATVPGSHDPSGLPGGAAGQLRRISGEFRDFALAIDRDAAVHFSRACARLPGMRAVCVHLGSRTHAAFLPAFQILWEAMALGLERLRAKVAEVRVEFVLRLSRRVVGRYEFGISGGLERALVEMDEGIECEEGKEEGAWEPTLSELGAVNDVRRKIAEYMWPGEQVGYWSGV